MTNGKADGIQHYEPHFNYLTKDREWDNAYDEMGTIVERLEDILTYNGMNGTGSTIYIRSAIREIKEAINDLGTARYNLLKAYE